MGLNQETKVFNTLDENFVNKLIAERNKARKEKDFKKADEIREKLNKLNIELEDTTEGTRWVRQK